MVVKRHGHEADNSPLSCAKVKNAWSYTSIPPIRLFGVTGTTLPLPYLTFSFVVLMQCEMSSVICFYNGGFVTAVHEQ
jgi:hypothetical protein